MIIFLFKNLFIEEHYIINKILIIIFVQGKTKDEGTLG